MSRKSFSNLTRQGKWKRIKKTILLENVHEQGLSYNEKEPKQGTAYSENEFQQSTFYNGNSHHSGQTYIPQYETENNKNFTQDQLQWKSYFLESSDDSDADNWTAYSDNEKVLESLRTWSVQFNITNVALSALLCILRTHKCFDLPLDARTLLKTPSNVEVQPVTPGHYYHFGLQNGLERLLCSIKEMITSVELLVGIDGLPLFNSSAGELWPILVSTLNVPTINSVVIPVGIYFGKKKPAVCQNFLGDFVNEAANLIRAGMNLNGRNISVVIKGFACDAPAKAFILGIKGHGGYSSCTKCKQEGIYYNNRVIFPDCKSIPRTHEGFLNKDDPEFHTGETSLIEIPGLHFINSFPLDYMHLVCLGVMRTTMYNWINGTKKLKFPARILQAISTNLLSIAPYIPVEFCRKPRELEQIKKWKATEFRQFLLYTGPIILYDVLNPDYKSVYDNFLSLCISMTILLSPRFCYQHREYSQELLIHFLKVYQKLYGRQYMTHNFHGLYHISQDVTVFGSLDTCSAFQFENYLQTFKKLIRKGDKPLQQIVKRLHEKSESDIKIYSNPAGDQGYPQYSRHHCSGPIAENCDASKQYKTINFKTFTLTNSRPNNCCSLTNGNVVIITNVTFSNTLKCMVVLCKEFLLKENFFARPLCESSELCIHQVSNLSDLKTVPVSEIAQKLVLLPFRTKHVAMPLLHL